MRCCTAGGAEGEKYYSCDKKLGERNRAALARAAEKGIEVVPAIGRAGKGNALKALCAHLGIEMSQLLVFGDSSNDLLVPIS